MEDSGSNLAEKLETEEVTTADAWVNHVANTKAQEAPVVAEVKEEIKAVVIEPVALEFENVKGVLDMGACNFLSGCIVEHAGSTFFMDGYQIIDGVLSPKSSGKRGRPAGAKNKAKTKKIKKAKAASKGRGRPKGSKNKKKAVKGKSKKIVKKAKGKRGRPKGSKNKKK